MRLHTVPAGVGPMPLEKYLRRAWPLMPGRVLRDALKKRDVKLNGARVGAEASVKGGDELALYIPDLSLIHI